MDKVQRFWDRVKVAGEADCWVWTAGQHNRGYGRLRWNKEPEMAHRVSWQIVNGPIPDGLYILHTCDNPLCCNPNHLYAGTAQDNTNDMMNRDRFSATRPTKLRQKGWQIRRIQAQIATLAAQRDAIDTEIEQLQKVLLNVSRETKTSNN